jgi:hypothetical protein
VDSPLPEGCFGGGTAPAGDFDGDGSNDVVVAAPCRTADAPAQGAAFLFPGPASAAMAGSSIRLVDPRPQDGGGFGAAAAFAGDVNGDGYGDVLVGAPRMDGVAADSGTAFVFCGQPARTAVVGRCATLDNPGGHEQGHFGQAVALLGTLERDR